MSDLWSNWLGPMCLLVAMFAGMVLIVSHSDTAQALIGRYIDWVSGRQRPTVVTPAERYAIDESIRASVTAAIAQMTEAVDFADTPDAEWLDPEVHDLEALDEAFMAMTDGLGFPESFEDARDLFSD